jgi:hypothetical protein
VDGATSALGGSLTPLAERSSLKPRHGISVSIEESCKDEASQYLDAVGLTECDRDSGAGLPNFHRRLIGYRLVLLLAVGFGPRIGFVKAP